MGRRWEIDTIVSGVYHKCTLSWLPLVWQISTSPTLVDPVKKREKVHLEGKFIHNVESFERVLTTRCGKYFLSPYFLLSSPDCAALGRVQGLGCGCWEVLADSDPCCAPDLSTRAHLDPNCGDLVGCDCDWARGWKGPLVSNPGYDQAGQAWEFPVVDFEEGKLDHLVQKSEDLLEIEWGGEQMGVEAQGTIDPTWRTWSKHYRLCNRLWAHLGGPTWQDCSGADLQEGRRKRRSSPL